MQYLSGAVRSGTRATTRTAAPLVRTAASVRNSQTTLHLHLRPIHTQTRTHTATASSFSVKHHNVIHSHHHAYASTSLTLARSRIHTLTIRHQSTRAGSDTVNGTVTSQLPSEEQEFNAKLHQLTSEGKFDEVERLAREDVDRHAKSGIGCAAHMRALRRLADMLVIQNRFPEAERVLTEVLSYQHGIFEHNMNKENFLACIDLLSHLVTCMRMSGIDPRDQTNIDTLFDKIYVEGVRKPLLDKGGSFAALLENPSVYTFVCYVVGAYVDGENVSRAKKVLNEHLLFDVDTRKPSTGTRYELADLRLASGLNFLGVIHANDHTACGGGNHSNHHHVHDHAAALKAWTRALEYTKPLTDWLHAQRPVGKLNEVDVLFLQATTLTLDNLAQTKMTSGDLSEALSYSESLVFHLQVSHPPLHSDLLSGQAALLKVCLECNQMDKAELTAEQMLASFPHPKPFMNETEMNDAVNKLPESIELETSRLMDELSQLCFQFGNLDYAEKMQQMSLLVLHARLPRSTSSNTVSPHPALARSYNQLGLLQLQGKDYENAEKNLQRGLELKLALAGAQGEGNRDTDETLAEHYHNVGLSQMGTHQLEKAETHLLKAKKLYEIRFTDKDTKQVNKIHAGYAGLMSQLAQLYKFRSDWDSALNFSRQALELKQQLFAPHSKQLVGDLYATAHLLSHSFKDHEAAIPLYKQLVSIVEKADGALPPNPMTLAVALHWLATAYDAHGEKAFAADAWRKSLAQAEKVMNPRELLTIQKELRRVLQELKFVDEITALDDKIEQTVLREQQLQQAAANKPAASS